MKQLLIVMIFVASVAPCLGADLAKTDRTIAKEPTYKSKQQHCLLVFGPESKMRVWLVLDGDTLYVDRNGDGDLTGQGKSSTSKKDSRELEITELDRKVTHRILSVTPWKARDIGSALSVTVSSGEKYRQFADCYPAKHPQKAPIVHFDGPRTFRLLNKPKLVPGQPAELQVGIETLGVGRDAFAYLSVDTESIIPEDVHPVAQIVFPSKDGGKEAVKVEVDLPYRC